MLTLRIERQFKKSARLAQKRGKNLNKLWKVVEKLQKNLLLERKHRPHRLGGEWYPTWECHIDPDWLLVYHITDNALVLIDTGSHADLFE